MITTNDVKTPLRGVLTPEDEFTAVREKEPVIGKAEKKDPIILQDPIAINS